MSPAHTSLPNCSEETGNAFKEIKEFPILESTDEDGCENCEACCAQTCLVRKAAYKQ